MPTVTNRNDAAMNYDLDPSAEFAALRAHLAVGPPAHPDRELPPPPPPMYRLSVDDPDERSIVLVVGQGGDRIWRATIALPRWHELPEGWDGPHEMLTAIRLANDYAAAYGYPGIAIDIESSQLWNDAWGKLETGRDDV